MKRTGCLTALCLLSWLVLGGAGWGQISVTLRTPNGGEIWEAGSAQNVTWETSGSPDSINLYYSIDNGASWGLIASGTTDDGSQSWLVQKAVTSQALVSIEAVKGAEAVTAESAAPFSIVDTTAPSVTVESPNGAEGWQGGSSHNITFSYSDLFGLKSDSLAIWYSTDNGATYPNLITADAAVSSPYSWTLPAISTTEVKVRVTVQDENSLAGTDESDAKFTIDSTAPAVTLVQPNSGLLTGEASYNILWAVTEECGLASPSPINIYYSTNSGASWTLVTNETNSGSYAWTVPNLNSTTARVSVEAVNLAGLAGSAMSSSDLTICNDFQGPAITVTAPAGTDKWLGGSTHDITFNANDATGIKPNSLSIWYSTDSGLTYPNQITQDAATSSPYSWTLPVISTTEVKVRVSLTDTAPVQNVGTGESAAFTIDSTAPAVTVIQPNGGEALSGDNATYEVTWAATEECGLTARPITIRYSTDSGASWTFVTTEANSGSYAWTVPHLNTTTGRISVEALNQVGLTGSDMSNADFSITSDVTGPSVTVSAPVTGDKWKGGSSRQISFSASDPSEVKPESYSIYYYNGSVWTAIVTDQTLTSPYTWNPVASINSQNAKVRVTARDIYDNLGTGESGAFTIDSTNPTVSLTAPTGGEKWQGGVDHNITWEASDNFGLQAGPVTLQYSTNGGAAWSNIAAGLDNTSPYTWPVPALNISQARVRVIVTDEAGNYDIKSSTDFIIDSTAPGTPVPQAPPNGSATSDATPTFSWTAPSDNLSGIASYEITIDTSVVTQGATTSYTQPSNLAEGTHTWEVRAKDGAGIWGNLCQAQSLEVLTSVPAISGITLKDTASGSTAYTKSRSVSLEASGVGARAFQLISSESSGFTGATWQTYINPTTFQLSSSQGSKTVYYKVRDRAFNESTWEAASITLDTFVPSVSVVRPNGGENLGGGLNYTINWHASDIGVGLTANPITIRYSTNSGEVWAMVASQETNSESYDWIVPSGIDSAACRISIEAVDLAGNVQSMQSSANFTIVAVGPAVPSVSWPANSGYVNSARPLIQWAAVSSAVSYECVLDTSVEATATNTYLPETDLADGTHSFRVRARNSANLWSPSSETVSFTVDTAAPATAFSAFTDSGNPQPTFRGTITDSFKIVSAEARLDGGGWLPVTAADGSFNSTSESFTFSNPSLLARGSHTLEARAYDAAGNFTEPPARLNFAITRSAVSFDVKMGAAAVTTGTIIPYRPTFTVVLSAAQPVVDFKVYIDDQSVYAHTGSFTSETVAISPFQDLAVGSHVLRMTTQDIAGDVSTSEITGLTVISDVRVFMTASAATITLAVNTSSSGPATLILRRPNGQTILQKSIPDIGEASEISISKYIAGENLKGPYLWKVIYNSGRSSKSGGFIVP